MSKRPLLVNRDKIIDIWSQVEPIIKRAVNYADGSILLADVLSGLLTDKFGLFVGMEDDEIDSALVLEFKQYPRKKVLFILFWATKSGHDYDSWIQYISAIEEFARAADCDRIEAYTRKGLARKLNKTLNWDNEYSVITKNL